VVACHASKYTRYLGALALSPAVLSTGSMSFEGSGARSRFQRVTTRERGAFLSGVAKTSNYRPETRQVKNTRPGQ
jgi:hypothetical protein